MSKSMHMTRLLWSVSAAALLLAGCAATPPTPAPVKADPLAGIPESIANVFPAAPEICGPITGGARNAVTEGHIQRFRFLLQKSETGRAMLENAARFPDKDQHRPLWICFEKMTGSRTPYAYYSWGRGVVAINTHMFDYPVTEGKQVSAAIHELRHAEQDAVFQTLRYANKTEAQIGTYASEADAEAINLLVQWEMKEAGYSAPWSIRSNPENFMQGYFCFASLHKAFEDAINNGGSKADATRAAFRAWHDNKSILQSYQGQGNMRWGMQESRDELKIKWEAEDRARDAEKQKRLNASTGANANAKEPRLAPRPPHNQLIPHTWATCQLPRTVIEAELQMHIPTPELSEKLDAMGVLPDGSGNYLQSGGGTRNILRHPARDAHQLRP